MAAEYNRPAQRTVDRHNVVVGRNLGLIVGLIAFLAIGALVFFTFFDRTPSAPTVVKSPAGVKTAPPSTTPTTK